MLCFFMMDIGKLLKNVQSLNEYISVTHDASAKCKTSKIQLNMSTVLALKKIRSLEIEYFNKCEDNGIACIIFERILSLPPSKTWGVLSKELVNLLQYWLDAIRKHLVRHNLQWWAFLKLLLKFVKEICQKDSSLPNILVEHTAECLLDLATNSRPDAIQRYEILHCFNLYCSESSREIRFALRSKFGQYFIKLSTYMASCGHLPTQYSIMETLLRWLLPRHDHTLRVASAAKWFPPALYVDKDVDIFLERPWVNFFQDARDFLNGHNQRTDLITSVVCKKLTVGKLVIISGTERQESWLDINTSTRCVSVLLDPRVLETFGASNHKSFETLVISYDNTHSAKLHRESLQLVLSIRTASPSRVLPSCGDSDADCDVMAVISTRCDVTRLHNALTKVFEDKYQVLLDLNKELERSPLKDTVNSIQNTGPEDTRFSHPVEVKKRKHSGYIVKSRPAVSCVSPSTASTSSLAQLHEKLAALPIYRFDKEPVSICAQPELSIVTEVSEVDDRTSLNTTLKICKPYGVCQKNFENRKIENKKSQSDPESSSKARNSRRLSPIINEDTTSCLLVATIGSADDSVINDTVERLSKNKNYNPDNIVDLLVQEALQAKNEDRYRSDSGINTGDKAQDNETIDNTPNIDETKAKTKVQKKVATVVSSTSDESNTEAINETPCYVNTRKKNKKEIPKETLRIQTFDEQVVEEFFTQHFTEYKVAEVVISPTLAKKINESNSETSENFGENFNLIAEDIEKDIVPYDFSSIDVLECINSMVDKVCNEFDKCTKYFNENDKMVTVDDDSDQENRPLQEIINTIQDIASKTKGKKKSDSKKSIKLKYKSTPKKTRARVTKKKNKLELEPISKMSTILEDNTLEAAEDIEVIDVDKPQEANMENPKRDTSPNEPVTTTSQIKRKRKLYSPKDEQIADDSTRDVDDETLLSVLKKDKTPKSTATCYKEIEKDRQRLRMPRARKSKQYEPPSPRTQKMNDMFDKIKESANGEKVKLADKTYEADAYNFTSDSDDDFKEKRLEISKKISTTTLGSVESAVSKRGKRTVKKINYTDKSSDESNKNKRKITRRPRTKKKTNVKQNELIDEKMRTAKVVLDTSIVVETSKTAANEPDLVLEIAPEMEVINEEKGGEKTESNKKKKGKKKTETDSKKAKRVLNKLEIEPKNIDEDRTESPLPGLLVEPVSTTKDDQNELSTTMVDKFKKIYQEGPDKYINESNTTQNLLSDVERINYSPPDIDITEELKQIQEHEEIKTIECKKPKPKVTAKSNKAKQVKTNKKDRITITSRTISENIEIISINETTVKSEKSIATIGITGHGDLEEVPPSPKLINEILEPRNLEIEDLNNSMKDYFDKLTKEMNESNNRDSSDSNCGRRSPIIVSKVSVRAKSSEAKTNSPVLSLKRLSTEDISRWLPSRRNSETEESIITEKFTKENTPKSAVKPLDSPKVTPSNHDDGTDISEINEPQRKSLRIIFKNLQTAKTHDSSKSKACDSESEIDESLKIENFKPKNTKTQPKKSDKTMEAAVKKEKRNPTSIISPIKLFDDLISNADKYSVTTLSEDEEYMKEIKHIAKTQEVNRAQRKLFKQKTPPKCQKNKGSQSNASSSHSKMSTSTKIEDAREILKRTSEEDREDSKKKRLEVYNNVEIVSGSGLTVSSVDDWFKRNEPEVTRAEIISASMRHNMQNLMERLDTTLVEIHRNTSKKFVHLFVDTQKHLSELKEARQNLYKRLASDILSEVVKIMDDKFADLDKRSQELDGDFMKSLKERASELIREDCKQKRAMVRLLKEDVQAVMDHTDRHGTL